MTSYFEVVKNTYCGYPDLGPRNFLTTMFGEGGQCQSCGAVITAYRGTLRLGARDVAKRGFWSPMDATPFELVGGDIGAEISKHVPGVRMHPIAKRSARVADAFVLIPEVLESPLWDPERLAPRERRALGLPGYTCGTCGSTKYGLVGYGDFPPPNLAPQIRDQPVISPLEQFGNGAGKYSYRPRFYREDIADILLDRLGSRVTMKKFFEG